jgi:hypothetical protein
VAVVVAVAHKIIAKVFREVHKLRRYFALILENIRLFRGLVD